jgi:two-component system, cell cycle sensor histidine kinase PleC
MFKRRIAAFSAAIMLAICALVAEAVINERNAALDRARIEAANLSASFEEQILNTLNAVSSATNVLKRRVEAEGAAFNLSEWRTSAPDLATSAMNIAIVNGQGAVTAATAGRDAAPVSFSDRDFFAALRDKPDNGLYIGQPVMGRISNRIIIPAARRLDAKDGRFAGVIALSLAPDLLTTLHEKVRLGQETSISLIRTDGAMLARYTTAKGFDAAGSADLGRKIEAVSGAVGPLGELDVNSPIDGILRLYHWRRVPGYPLIVAVGLGKGEVLANANRQAAIVIGLGVAALCLPLIMMVILNREISRRVENAIALDQESEKLRQEHAALLSISEELAGERIKLRKANVELIRAKRRAEEASDAKSSFLANMSHELRTPLNAILGFSEIIRDKLLGRDVDRYAAYAADIHRSGAHLLNIVNDILDVTRIEAGKVELQEERVRVEPLLQRCMVAVEQQAISGGVQLACSSQDPGALVYGDKHKLKQILVNLLSNAIKFTPAGGRVGVAARAELDGGLSISIQDTGIGMTADEIRQALELFRQVDNSLSRRFEGAGLGLPLAVRLIELHGGALDIESTPGVGTTVTVRLPPGRVVWEKAAVTKLQKDNAPLKIAS